MKDPDLVHERRWLTLVVLCVSLLVIGIDNTVLNVAIPTLAHPKSVGGLGASVSQLQWIVDAYTIIFASFLLIAGNTGDRLGRKGCFVFGLVVFGGGSLGCSMVDTPNALIVLRGVQGFGAAFIMPATLSILANVFTDEAERARAIALWAGVSGLGVAIGPLVGGYLLEHFWWGSVFLVNVPIVALTIVGVLVLVPDSRDEHAPALDLLGTVLSTAGLIALLFGIIEGPARGWGAPIIVAAFVGAAVLLTTFVLWERRTDHPILDVTFFRNPRFTAASVAVTLVFFAMFGSLFFVSQYLQFVLGYSALESGVRLLPVALALMVAAPVSAQLVARLGTKVVVTAGLVLVAGALALFSTVDVDSGYGLVGTVLVVIGLGMGFAMAPAPESIMGSLPPEKAGVGSAMNDTTREVGGALGVAILGSITAAAYTSRITSDPRYAQLAAQAPAAAGAVRDSVGGASLVASALPADVASAITAAANEAYVHAVNHTVVVGAAVALLGALVALLFLPARSEVSVSAAELTDAVTGAARRLSGDDARRRDVGRATLELLADAGMASLTFHGVAARSGIGTATLQRVWTSRVDAAVDAIQQVYAEHPVPDTGDVRRDLVRYLGEVAGVVSTPRARGVLGSLIAESARDPDLAAALQARLVQPRQRELATRLERAVARGEIRLDVPVPVAGAQLVGPVYYRALVTMDPIDDELLGAVVDGVLVPAA